MTKSNEYLIKLTIRPSPLPRSTSVPLLPPSALTIFVTCSSVAGTYGRHIFLTAGRMNGKVKATDPITPAPTMPTVTFPANDNALGSGLKRSCSIGGKKFYDF